MNEGLGELKCRRHFVLFCREGDIDFEIPSILTIFPEFLQ